MTPESRSMPADARQAAAAVSPPCVYCRKFEHPVGELALQPLRIPEDIPVVHAWVSQEYARFWGLRGRDVHSVEQAYRMITAPEHTNAYLGLHDGTPAFLVETYWPLHELVGQHYPATDRDRGMHVLAAPPQAPIAGFTWAVFTLIMDFLFDDPGVDRVVVEPDVRNRKIIALNRRAGFREISRIDLPETAATPAKTGLLSFCTRADYAAAREQEVRPPCR